MLKGLWYYRDDFGQALDKAQRMEANTVVIKVAGHPNGSSNPPVWYERTAGLIQLARDRGLMVAAELYAYPWYASVSGQLLARAVREGCQSAILNAEAEWEPTGDGPSLLFLESFDGAGPLGLCTDVRGERLSKRYHQVLIRHADSLHPMVYHKAFYPETPYGDLQKAFDAAFIHGLQAHSLPKQVPVFPVLQAYSGVDWEEALGGAILSHLFGAAGSSVYVSHDLNERALLGARDGWRIVERLRQPDSLDAGRKEQIVAATTAALRAALGG